MPFAPVASLNTVVLLHILFGNTCRIMFLPLYVKNECVGLGLNCRQLFQLDFSNSSPCQLRMRKLKIEARKIGCVKICHLSLWKLQINSLENRGIVRPFLL